jgi:hypothetical protein
MPGWGPTVPDLIRGLPGTRPAPPHLTDGSAKGPGGRGRASLSGGSLHGWHATPQARKDIRYTLVSHTIDEAEHLVKLCSTEKLRQLKSPHEISTMNQLVPNEPGVACPARLPTMTCGAGGSPASCGCSATASPSACPRSGVSAMGLNAYVFRGGDGLGCVIVEAGA